MLDSIFENQIIFFLLKLIQSYLFLSVSNSLDWIIINNLVILLFSCYINVCRLTFLCFLFFWGVLFFMLKKMGT